MIILPLNLPSISQVKQVKQIPCELFPTFLTINLHRLF